MKRMTVYIAPNMMLSAPRLRDILRIKPGAFAPVQKNNR